MVLRELIVKLGFNVDATKLKNFDSWVKKTSTNLKNVSKQMTGLGQSMSLKLTLPIAAMGAVMLKAASDAEETESKFNVVFSNMATEANNMANELDQSYGLSATAAKTLLGDTGDLLTGFGFTQKSALDLSGQVQKLAVDLASFTNFSGGAKGASAALTKALLGERESVKSLGISILEEDVKARVALNTSKGMTFATNRQAKAFATLQIAQDQSKNAIGDYARTQSGLANQWRETLGDLNDLAVGFGKILIPPAKAVLKVFKSMVNWFKNLSENSKKLILTIMGILAVIGPLLIAIGSLIGLIGVAMTGFTGLAASIGITSGALLILMAKFILIGVLIAAAFAVIFLVVDDLIAYFSGEDSMTAIILKEVEIMAYDIGLVFRWMGYLIKEWAIETSTVMGQAFKDVSVLAEEGIGSAIDYLTKKFNGMSVLGKMITTILTHPIRLAIASIRTLGGVLGAISMGDFSGALEAVKEGVGSAVNLDIIGNNGLGGLLGFGPSEKPTTPEANRNINTVSATNVSNVNAPISIEVPPGTPPEEVATAAKEGVMESLDSLFQDTGRQLLTPIAE